MAVAVKRTATAEGANVYADGSHICNGKIAAFTINPIIIKLIPALTELLAVSSEILIVKSAIFRVPVTEYNNPTPIT